jgi:uncharacterized membrane protein YeaQ/YmgE (transglycosylase-associated protein family)
MLTLIGMLILGLVAGAIARFLVPGRDPLGLLGTALLGIVGSFVGGFLASLVLEGAIELRTTGLFGSILGAVLALLVYRRLVDRRAPAS